MGKSGQKRRLKVEFFGMTLVFRGTGFDGLKFHPHTMGSFLSSSEISDIYEDGRTIISSGLLGYTTARWEISVQSDRVTVGIRKEQELPVLPALGEHIIQQLDAEGVSGLGFNLHRHYKTSTTSVWHDIGQRLVPKTPYERLMKTAGLRSVTIEGKAQLAGATLLTLKIEPSVLVKNGIFASLNQHYESNDLPHVLENIGDEFRYFCGFALKELDHILRVSSE